MTITGFVRSVQEKPIYNEPDWVMTRRRVGTRYNVFVHEGGPLGAMEVYTRDRDVVARCLAAKQAGHPITLETARTRWGIEIRAVSEATREVQA